jgi:hypothetical protein
MRMTRFQKIIVALVAALVILVGVGVIVVVNVAAQTSAQQSYEQCLEDRGFTRGSASSNDLAALAAAAEDCSK